MSYIYNTVNPEECNECALKQKYVSGSNLKCLKHMFEERQKQIHNQQLTQHDQIMENLQNIQNILPQYSAEISLFSYQQTFTQINQIIDQIDKIKVFLQKIKDHKIKSQTSLDNFTIYQPFKTNGKFSQTPNHSTFDKSPNFSTFDKSPDFSNFDNGSEYVSAFQDQKDSINQSIKNWVIYFSDKLLFVNQKKKFLDETELPFEQDFEMRAFKQKMNEKYFDFMRKVEEKNKLLNQAINKLAEYVDLHEKKGKRSNSVFELSSKFRNKIQNPNFTIRGGLSSSKAQYGRQTSKNKTKIKQTNSFKANNSSFMIENVSGIFPTPEVSNEKTEETYLLLVSQAQCIQVLLQQNKDQSLLL